MNARMLNDICFIPFRRQQHEMTGMVDEILRQRTCATTLQMTDERDDVVLSLSLSLSLSLAAPGASIRLGAWYDTGHKALCPVSGFVDYSQSGGD